MFVTFVFSEELPCTCPLCTSDRGSCVSTTEGIQLAKELGATYLELHSLDDFYIGKYFGGVVSGNPGHRNQSSVRLALQLFLRTTMRTLVLKSRIVFILCHGGGGCPWFHFPPFCLPGSRNGDRFYFLGPQSHCGQWLQPRNSKMLGSWVDFLDSSVGKESACNAGDTGSVPGLGRPTGEGKGYPLQYCWASLVAQLVKNPPAMRRPGYDPWVGKIPWRRERLPTPVFWPGEFHGL